MIEVRDMRDKGWYFINTTVTLDYGHILKPIGIAVYNVLAARADNKDQDCYPSQKGIAETIGASESSVWRAIKQLEELGLIHIDPQFRKDGGRTSNVYTLLTPPPFTGTPPSITETDTPPSEGPTNYPKEELSSEELLHAADECEEDQRQEASMYYRDENVTTQGRVHNPPWFVACPSCDTEIKVDVLDRPTECLCALGVVTLLSKRKGADVKIPEALLVYRKTTNRNVAPAWRGEVVKSVGNNIDFWQDVVKAYVGLGWNAGNVANMLKYFERGELPTTRTKKVIDEGGGETTHTPLPPGGEVELPSMTEEEIAQMVEELGRK